jgi:predicted dehydrogenase
MSSPKDGRREFMKTVAGTAAIATQAALARATPRPGPTQAPAAAGPAPAPRLRFGVIGLNHGHIYGQVAAAQAGGGQLAAFHAKEDDLAAAFLKRYPDAKRVTDEREILEDAGLKLVLSASIPSERGPLGIRVMRHGKDFMVDKPGLTTLEQLAEARRAQKETGRIYSIDYSESFGNRAVVRAGELVKAGAIGRVVQTIGLGPHRETPASRPEWFWDKKYYGGILCDIAAHQAYHFLSFTGSTRADVVAAQVANLAHPTRPEFEDFGDVVWRGDAGAGYVRVDWFTPDGLPTWGDGRVTVLGTDGYLEIRTNVDIAGRKGGEHLFLVDRKETRYVDCSDQKLAYGERLVSDVLDRTQTAMPQERCFLAMELVLRAQAAAQKVTFTERRS